MIKERNRWIYSILIIFVVLLGLSSRTLASYLPRWIGDYAGDTLWALMIFLLIGLLFKNATTLFVGSFAVLFSYFIEITQLYHAPWIDGIRQTILGGLVLGFGFLWSDLVCYTIGVSIGVFMECFLFKYFGMIRIYDTL
ncbi:DUF2809 domain-containing protein [Crassaminicella profunda]|uniref:ribosomal maturation YjgA family protein n=1 Tax=Crassaminicella profunda TaxID=1286698 RepID=UPI001CA68836|nr:DUF2809 domain-containing protein [Crassaminicella profunda]QZY57351.1 DUF2809 domain-containing protein [Crassaminicella profunda]